MKTKSIIITAILICVCFSAEAQILKKLKKQIENTTERVLTKKTDEKTEEVVDKSVDGVLNPDSKDKNNMPPGEKSNTNEAKLINTEAKRSFYTTDVVVKTSDSKGKGSEYYFDSDEIAARGLAPNGTEIYIDSEAYQYGFNEHEGRWEKTGLFKSDAMSFMMPMMSMGIIKLPPEPTLNTTEKLKEKGLSPNTFQIVEWAFIYKPEHFRSDAYEETTAPCPTGGNCPKFIFKDTENKGSWVIFDKQDRLSEIYANVNTQQAQGTGTYKFEYTPVTVNLPYAVEVKQPFQDLFARGLDADPNNSNAGSPVSNNNAIKETPVSTSSNPNESIARIDPANPLSFPGVTSVLEAEGRKVTLMLNTETMAMKVDLHDPGMKPIYYDRNNFLYMESGDGCIKAKIDLGKAFSQVEENLKENTLPQGMDMEKVKKDYYKNNFGMTDHPANFPPITGWAYLYNPTYLELQDNFEKSTESCDSGSCQKFTMTEGKEKGSYVLFDQYNRLKKIYSSEANGATVTYTYPSHSDLRIPDFQNCQEIDLNEAMLGKMMGG